MQVLRNVKTNEIYPLNGDMQRHEDIEVIDVPNLDKARMERGRLVLEDNPNPPASKRRGRPKKTAAKGEAESTVDVESTPENPEGDSDGDDAS